MRNNAFDGLKVLCPYCGTGITISYNTARCNKCDWFAADADLEEVLGMHEGLTHERFAQMYKAFEGDVGQIEEVVELWGTERCNRGYDIFNFDNTGCLEIEAISDVNAFDDEEAVRKAIEDGIKIIPVEELPESFDRRYLGWIDTQENRLAIEEYCKSKGSVSEEETITLSKASVTSLIKSYIDELEEQEVMRVEIDAMLLDIFPRQVLEELGFCENV